MTRTMGRLTAKEVEKKTIPGNHGDGGGLTLQITKAGVKSWLYRYMINGKARWMGLGPVHSVHSLRLSRRPQMPASWLSKALTHWMRKTSADLRLKWPRPS